MQIRASQEVCGIKLGDGMETQSFYVLRLHLPDSQYWHTPKHTLEMHNTESSPDFSVCCMTDKITTYMDVQTLVIYITYTLRYHQGGLINNIGIPDTRDIPTVWKVLPLGLS